MAAIETQDPDRILEANADLEQAISALSNLSVVRSNDMLRHMLKDFREQSQAASRKTAYYMRHMREKLLIMDRAKSELTYRR